ncbi:hypothetical protein ACFLS9_05725, partial [Bacteroidota bacterium]
IILSFVTLRILNSFISTETVLMENKFGILASSLATSFIEQASSKAFDEFTDTNSVDDVKYLSAYLGPEYGEVYPDFDDFDDYNGFLYNTGNDTTIRSAVFDIACKVNYINSYEPDIAQSGRSWNKKLTVTVTSPSMVDTIRLSTINSYWFYR